MSKNKKVQKKRGWRRAVKEVMHDATEREVRRRHGSADASFNYRWEHVTAVVTLALRLAKLTGADAEVVEAAAWLHDVRKDSKNDHPKEGAEFARKFLPQTDFPAHKIERVARTIADHMGLWREKPLTELESMVLWDADKLAKIGLTAAFHWTGWALAGSKLRGVNELIERGRLADWQEKTVASMHTKPARKAAKRRLKAYRKLWDNLEIELRGDDLEPDRSKTSGE
jgi:uncharacterized protein